MLLGVISDARTARTRLVGSYAPVGAGDR